MPRIVDHHKRKASILLHALSLFEENGLTETTLTQIASRCKIGRPTLYQYFRNKDEIFQYSIKYYTDNMFLYYQKVSSKEGSPLEKIEKILVSLTQTMIQERQFLHALVSYYASLQVGGRTKEFHQGIRRRTIHFRRLIHSLLLDAAHAGEIQIHKARSAESIMVLIQNIFFQVGIFDLELDPILKNQIKMTIMALTLDL
ncbi:MAG: TetR/AcrR family transcriptional regulator [Spirochaetia bacterium]